MTTRIYGFTALTGGGTGSLDKYPEAGMPALATDDYAIGHVSGLFYLYRFDGASAEAESPPDVIAPDSGSGRWILKSLSLNHNDLMNIDGGNVSPEEYYHLSSALYNVINNATAQSIVANPTGAGAPVANVTVAEQTLVGRITGGNVDDLSASQVRTLLNVGDGAKAASDTAYGSGWDGVTDVAPSKNAVYDEMELRAPKANPTISGLLTLSGGQIKFPASQSASSDVNTLDDYEEGTWTPAFTPATGSFATMTASVQGAYVKIGTVVFISGYIMTTDVDVTGASGNLTITGLPFSPIAFSAIALGYTASWVNHPIELYMASGASTLYLCKRSSTTGASALSQVSDLTTGKNANYNRIYFGGVYFTT